MTIEWPAEPIDLTACAELFGKAGHTVDRTNLGRFIASRDFPVTMKGRRKLVDARQLFEAFTQDFTRAVMAGETTDDGAPLPSSSAPPLDGAAGGKTQPAGGPSKYDPKRELAELKVQGEQLELAERLGRTVPVEEVAAAQGEAMAKLIAALAEAANDVADELLQDLHLPAHMRPKIRAGLKRLARKGREAFAVRMAELMRAAGETNSEARARLDALTLHAMRLSGQAADDEAEREPALQA